eukprot:SAG25_NODE_1985_length_2059_cov_2.356633_1_plen_144_part_00
METPRQAHATRTRRKSIAVHNGLRQQRQQELAPCPVDADTTQAQAAQQTPPPGPTRSKQRAEVFTTFAAGKAMSDVAAVHSMLSVGKRWRTFRPAGGGGGGGGGVSFVRVHWDAVPKALRARRVNRRPLIASDAVLCAPPGRR